MPSYRALVGERTFDFELKDGRLRIDGEPVDHAFEPTTPGCYWLLIDGRSRSVVVEPVGPDRFRVTIDGRTTEVQVQDERALLLERFGWDDAAGSAARELHAPMPGLVLRVLVEAGQAVKPGDGLVVLEAMKMENELRADAAGVVKAVHVGQGEAVGKNALLVEFEG